MNFLFRTDASVTMGTGHVMRCLALAQAWQDAGGHAVFALAESPPAIRQRLSSESCEALSLSSLAGTTEDLRETIALARERKADWIVVDGYQFNAEYQGSLKAAGFKIVAVDDYAHAGHYSADLVLNQNVCASEESYADREPHTRLLVGPRYCLLRREFRAWRDWKREISPTRRRVLVTMGGSDPKNLTAAVLEGLDLVKAEYEAIVVVGGSNPHFNFLDSFPQRTGKKVSVRRDVTNMAELMAWADVAVSSAGSTCWELCLLALPSILVDVAENQTAVARELGRRGCAIHLGGSLDFSAARLAEQLDRLLGSDETWKSISLCSRELVDGNGAVRVLSAMRGKLRLRPAQESDCPLLWEWANDPPVRAAAFSSAAISWEQHKVWFASKMKNPDCRILVAEDDEGTPVGQFRVDWRSEQEGDVDVSVSGKFRGAGYGRLLVDLGASSALAERGKRLHAFVKLENQPSRRAFESAGFTSLGEAMVQGRRAVHYVRQAERGK